MKYILLANNTVKEIIPDIDPLLPDFPIEKRYPAAFLATLIPVEDNVEVEQNWLYENGTFAPPPEPIEETEEVEE